MPHLTRRVADDERVLVRLPRRQQIAIECVRLKREVAPGSDGQSRRPVNLLHVAASLYLRTRVDRRRDARLGRELEIAVLPTVRLHDVVEAVRAAQRHRPVTAYLAVVAEADAEAEVRVPVRTARVR